MVSGLKDLISEFDRTSDIREWLQDIDNAILAAYGENVPDARKRAIISTCIGQEGKNVINNLPANLKDTYEHLHNGLTQHYERIRNVTVERHKFNLLRQEQEEPIELYVTKLQTQAAKCHSTVQHTHVYQIEQGGQQVDQQHVVETDIAEQFIRDRLVCGIYDQTTRAKLLRERNLTLQTAIDTIKAVENANAHVKKLWTNPSSAATVDKINRSHRNAKNKHEAKPQIKCNSSGNGQVKLNKKTECGRCGGPKHSRSQCPATKAVCHNCNIEGHYAKKCRTKKLHQFEQESAANTSTCYDGYNQY